MVLWNLPSTAWKDYTKEKFVSVQQYLLAISAAIEIDLLKEQLAAMQKKLYGNSSEKRPSNTDVPNTEEKKPHRGHGPRSQPDLPIEVVTHALPEDEYACSICGRQVEEMGDHVEESEEVTVVGIGYKVVKHQRKKYRCRCNEQVKTAPGPDNLIPGGRSVSPEPSPCRPI